MPIQITYFVHGTKGRDFLYAIRAFLLLNPDDKIKKRRLK